jgi:hypothetical protein
MPKLVIIILIASLLMVPGVVLAAEGGTGPGDAYTAYGAWQTLNPGQSHWYKFMYDGEDGQISVKMDATPSSGASFAVVTPEQARIWEETGDLEACGCGGTDEFVSADLSWSGSFNAPGTYYVLVKHSGTRTTPTSYMLTVDGDGVSVPAAPSVKPAAAAPVVAAAPAAAPAPASANDWMAMEGTASHWESFYYGGKGSQIHVYLDAEPSQAVNFSVWTPEEARLFGLGEDVEPVGRGSENKFAQGDKSWSGSFTSPGTYYVRIDHTGPGTSYCKLMVTGDDVTF